MCDVAERDEATQAAQHAKRGTDIWYSRYKAVAADLALSQRQLAVALARSATLALVVARASKDGGSGPTVKAIKAGSGLSTLTSSTTGKANLREALEAGSAAGLEQDPLSFGVSFGGLSGGAGGGHDEEEELRERLSIAEQELAAVSDDLARVKAEYGAQGVRAPVLDGQRFRV